MWLEVDLCIFAFILNSTGRLLEYILLLSCSDNNVFVPLSFYTMLFLLRLINKLTADWLFLVAYSGKMQCASASGLLADYTDGQELRNVINILSTVSDRH